MKKETTIIPSHIALTIVVILASIAAITILVGNYQLNQLNSAIRDNPIPVKVADECSIKAFAGQAQIHVWPVAEEAKDIVSIKDADISQLPPFVGKTDIKEKNLKVKIIDLTPELEATLASATQDNPAAIKIQGYLSRCQDKIALASLEYKDKIFSNHLDD